MKHTPLYRKYKYKHLYLIVGCWLLSFSNTSAQISGTVFKDFNNDGFQTPPHELGMRNITVSVYSSSFPTIAKQTDINGNYSFSAQEVPVGSKVRVEFTGLGAHNDGKKAGNSNTNVQFLTVPSGGASNINLGILTNTDYCQIDGTLIYTPCYVNGNALGGGSAGEDDALVSFPYYATGVGGTTGPMPVHIAKASEVGSLWGMDYQARGKTVLSSAITRRHVGLGPLGTGGIYKFDAVTSALGQLVDVKTIGIDTGPDPHTDLPADKLLTSQDAASVDAAGKIGIGGIALSGDEKTLYMVNLYDRKLYSFFVGVPAKTPSSASVKSYAIPNPCGNNDYRPWGVKEYQGNFYLGVVCTNETSQDSTTLSATIYKFNPKTGEFSVFYQFPLTYKRGEADATDACQNIRYWRPWSNTFPVACSSFFDAEYGKVVGSAINPQPIVSDIEFDTDGSMIIGLMDRFGLITGFKAMAPVDDGKLYDGFVSGDILRVYNNNGVYEMENNGQAGPLTGSGVNNDEGFGGGEFYGRDYWEFFGNPAHSEITNGGLMLMPGTGEVLASAMDPVDEVFHAGGFHIYSNTDGSLLRSFAVYAGKKGTLGKSGGVGDMKASCGVSFIEIGNRVWIDTNKNGVQDPDENGVGGVTVTLHDMEKGGLLVGSTITSPTGEYIFDNSNVSDTVRYEHKYQIRIDMSQGSVKTKDLIDVALGGNPILPDEQENPDEMRDSDAKWVRELPPLANQARQVAASPEGYAVIDFQTGATTLSNHSLDIGLTGCTPPTNVTASSNSPVVEGTTINFTSSSTGGNTYSWTGPNGFTSTTQNPSIASATLAANGTYTVTILSSNTCTATATTVVIVTPTCTPPTLVTASSNSPVNQGSTINLTSTSTGGTAYAWTGPNSFSSTTQNPSISSATLTTSGVYTVTVFSTGTCTATATTSVIVTPTCTPPTLVTASSNSPVAEGSPINFTMTSTGGTAYAWTGPNGFISTIQNPSIPSATLAASGTYNLIVLSSGTCLVTVTTAVIVTPTCTPPTSIVASSNSPVNQGSTINLTASSTGGTAYAWTGPNSFSSTTQNPSIASATLTTSGVYTVTVFSTGTCTATATTSVIVTPTCTPPTLVTASSNSPVAEGATINLTATSVGGTAYAWTGPNGFISTIQNPSIPSATLAASGTYNLIVLSSGTCLVTVTTAVVVTPTCTPPTLVTASSNSPVNQGSTINLTSTSTGGTAYAWTGPNGFSSTTQNPSIASATLTMSGVYTVTVFSTGTCTATATTSVIVTPTCTPPTLVTASNNSPVNQGSTINLTASSTGGTAYAWKGPNGFSSTTQNPSIASASASNAGIYTLTVFSSGTCTATATTSVILSAATCIPPTLVVASSNSPVNQGSTINLTASSTGGIAYAWTGPNGFSSTTQNPSITSASASNAGTYTLTVLSSGTCTATATTSVIVTPTCTPPTLVTASSNSPIEDGGTINLKATAVGATSFAWTGPNGFTSNLQNPSISAATYTRTGTYTVRAKVSEDCSTMASTFVLVTPPCTIACIPIRAKKIK